MANPLFKFAMSFEGLTITLKETILWNDTTRTDTGFKFLVRGGGATFEVGHTVSHTLEPNKVYEISLVVAPEGFPSDIETWPIKRTEVVFTDDTTISLYSDLYTVLNSLLPNYTYDWSLVLDLQRKFQGIVGPALGLPPEQYYDETLYPSSATTLIGYLIVRDLLIREAQRQLLDVAHNGGLESKIVTGPTEVDYETGDKILKTLMGSNMPYTLFVAQLCYYASKYKLHFTGCSQKPTPFITFYPSDYSYEEQYITAPQFTKKL